MFELLNDGVKRSKKNLMFAINFEATPFLVGSFFSEIGNCINILNVKQLELEKNIAKNHLFKQKIRKLRLLGPVT